MRLTEASKKLGISPDALRKFLQQCHYNKRCLGGHYRFTEEDLKRIDYDMTQEEINRHPERRLFKRRRLRTW